MIEAKIVLDSVNPVGDRLTTFVCTYPRFYHQELLTHRMLSRNSSSSRAIPVQKMIERILQESAEPISWGKNQRGMQANEELDSKTKLEAQTWWLAARDKAVDCAKNLLELGVHKQIANRLLEPFAHMTTIITATDWSNFFNLRAHKDAMPEFQELAFQMLALYRDSKPVEKKVGEWHIPFGDKYVTEGLSTEQLLKIATARCARVSYLTFDDEIDHEKDYVLHDQLADSGHWSAFEHCAMAQSYPYYRVGNFVGWFQYRKQFLNENRSKLNIEKLFAERRTYGA